jgi:putative transposase
MPRPRRRFLPGHVYHLYNRGVRRHRLFEIDHDYEHFQELMGRAHTAVPIRLIAYCLMPNHWHLVAWVGPHCRISAYMQRLTRSHSRYFNRQYRFTGHAYESRFKHRVVNEERHLLTLLRYVESNPVQGGLVEHAEQWPWSSLHPSPHVTLTESPIRRPACWLDFLSD